MKPWFGFDLDGTLAEYHGWNGPHHIGAPIPLTVERLKKHLIDGDEVRIFTARVAPPDPFTPLEEFSQRAEEVKISTYEIKRWCFTHIGKVLPITYQKDFGLVNFEDDRVTQIETNTGRKVSDVARAEGYVDGYADGLKHYHNEEHGITD